MLANPEELRGVARSLRSTKGYVDNDHAALYKAGAVFQTWRGPAADDVRSTLFPICLNVLGMVTRDLDDLALMLERAADELTQRLAKIGSIEANARHWFSSQAPPPPGETHRWEREWWKYRPGRFPASGDSAWLDAGPYLQSRGVRV